jgi:hypothetical protein
VYDITMHVARSRCGGVKWKTLVRLRKGGEGFIYFLANIRCHDDDVMAKYSNTIYYN